MALTVTIYDETLPGERTHSLRLEVLTSTITLRELIRRRVYEEVQEYHAAPPSAVFHGLVTPSPVEVALNGPKPEHFTKRHIDWEAQYEKALSAFARNGFFVLVGDRQVGSLDEEITLKVDTEVSFVKLVALVGG
ncbi:MAG: hypothetical protein ACRYFS_04760 [Janthinobacterium lividum]